MARHNQISHDPPKKSLIKRIFQVLILLILGAISFLIFQTFRAQPLSDINGYAEKGIAKNLKAELEQTVRAQGRLRVSEMDVNLYLKKYLKLEQPKLEDSGVKVKGVYVRLTDGEMEVVFEREIRGYPHTISLFMKAKTVNDVYGRPVLTVERSGARLGVQKLPPAYVLIVQESFNKLHEALKAELELAFNGMRKITFREGEVEFSAAPIEGALGSR